MFINIKENINYAEDISMMMTAAFNGFYSIDDTIELINKSFISLGLGSSAISNLDRRPFMTSPIASRAIS